MTKPVGGADLVGGNKDMAGGGGVDMAGGGGGDMALAQGDMALPVGCKSNADCPKGTCDPNTGICNVCAADGDCKDAMNPRCDVDTSRCVPCLPMMDNCGMGKFCTKANGEYSCAPGCQKDADCDKNMGNGKPLCCNNICVDSNGDDKNCGACANACGMGLTCCTGACADTVGDVGNCGGCGKACAGQNAMLACAASACVLKMCNDGFADCDKNEANGCEVNLNTDSMNCTACGMSCSVAHGAAACNKACSVAMCDPGFANCDKDYMTGCEVDTSSDVKNCNACNMACGIVSNGAAGCAMGMCGVGSCTGSFQDCDKMGGNGCEVDTSASAANCGMCGMACPAPANASAACTAGVCGIGKCTAGFTDCDMKAANGCEVATGTDIVNCGGCAKKCGAVANATIGCAAGVCGIDKCTAGFSNCNMNSGDGCEVNTDTDIKNCGACAKMCPTGPNTQPTCIKAVCGFAACAAPLKHCSMNVNDGCETNTSNDVSHCGACNAACPNVFNGVRACVNSICTVGTCNQNFADCDKNPANGCEIQSSNDIKNCGACAAACALANTSQSCVAGVCAVGTCTAPFNNCDGNPVNGCESSQLTDVNNCGGCAKKCAANNASVACTAGACGIAMCTAPFLDCNKTFADGCELNGSSDLNNCGACAMKCPAIMNGVAACAASKCGIASCNAPFADCDKQVANGGESNTSNDAKNCGGCGVVCNGACVNGACRDKILIIGGSNEVGYYNDIQSKLVATAAFQAVDVFAANFATPTLATLQKYNAVLVYSHNAFQDPVALGNNLADYFDGGGRVVLANFSNVTGFGKLQVAGRWTQANGYLLIGPATGTYTAEAAAITISEPGTPLVAGVTKLTAPSGFKVNGAVLNGATIVAKWGSGANLIVRGVKAGKPLVQLNMFPPSATVNAGSWSGDGAIIMKNALLWRGFCHSIVGKNGAKCASGKIDFCDPNAKIVATNAPQALAACTACYGVLCLPSNSDCAGAAYGPKVDGGQAQGEAYFGYVAGCSGAAGRIWSMFSSNTTYGRWAP
ncbi:MAG: hypothetical protein EXR72_15965 [Myxococcales bacterium]|nr:hypothetical protein [Myxococcales bacterium]